MLKEERRRVWLYLGPGLSQSWTSRSHGSGFQSVWQWWQNRSRRTVKTSACVDYKRKLPSQRTSSCAWPLTRVWTGLERAFKDLLGCHVFKFQSCSEFIYLSHIFSISIGFNITFLMLFTSVHMQFEFSCDPKLFCTCPTKVTWFYLTRSFSLGPKSFESSFLKRSFLVTDGVASQLSRSLWLVNCHRKALIH